MLASALAPSAIVAQPQQQPPAWIQRGQPGEGHEALRPLLGTWRVEKTSWIGAGTRKRPSRGFVTARREALADGRYIRDITEGDLGGSTYWRLGLLGYSTMDRRYEWVTVDNANANMMVYVGRQGAGPGSPLEMRGTFTDQGLLGEGTRGRSIGMRTVITIEGPNRHRLDLYFTPPGQPEFLADRAIYTRQAEPKSSDGAAVRGAEAALLDAYRGADADALGRLFASDYVFISSSGARQDRQGVMRDYATGRIRTERMTVLDSEVRELGDVAVVTGRQAARDLIDGRPVEGERRFTRVYRRSDGEWRLLSFQLSPPLTPAG